LEGNIVISVGVLGHSGDFEVWENQDENTITKTKKMLDDMHKRKIDMADEIFVIDVGEYIGESTKSEIAYAKKKNKIIRYYSQEISSDIQTYAFQKLTPNDNADLNVYEDALEFVFGDQNKDVQNIAVTGVYGSGKSSVVNTYERKYKKKFIILIINLKCIKNGRVIFNCSS
jgi:glutathionyl-hydroquinone reductase